MMLLLIIICIIVLSYMLSGYFKAILLSLKLEGPPTVPILGNAHLIANKNILINYAGPGYRLYGPLVRIWFFILPYFAVLDPTDLKTILSSKQHTEKNTFYRFMHNFIGNGLITLDKQTWNTHRKLIQPIFHIKYLVNYIDTFSNAAESLILNFKTIQNDVNITNLINNCVMDVLSESILGVQMKKSSCDNDSFTKDSPFRKGKIVLPFRLTRPWLLLDYFYSWTDTAITELNQKKELNEFTAKMITVRRKLLKENPYLVKKCFLDYLIEISDNNPEFTENDIINEACTFMLAGQDSVGAAISFCLFLLAQHSEYQQRCYQEINNVIMMKSSDKPNERFVPTLNDLSKMEYLEQCIKETLRLYPSVPLIARKLGENVKIGKHEIGAGNNVLIIPFATHRIEHIYPNPEQFDPDRFSYENISKRHPYAFIPFSAGPRNCIGFKFAIIEMKTIISIVLANFQLYPVNGKTKIHPIFRLTVRAHGGLWVKLEPRNLATK